MMARSAKCQCLNNFTCGYCLRNAPSRTREDVLALIDRAMEEV